MGHMSESIITTKREGGGGLAIAGGASANGAKGKFIGTGALTPMQKALVTAYVRNGGSLSKSMAEAGYTSRSGASAALRLPQVRQAIYNARQHIIENKISTLGVVALRQILEDKDNNVPHHVKLSAAKYAIELGGHKSRDLSNSSNGSKPLSAMNPDELRSFIAETRRTVELTKAAGRAIEEAEAALAQESPTIELIP